MVPCPALLSESHHAWAKIPICYGSQTGRGSQPSVLDAVHQSFHSQIRRRSLAFLTIFAACWSHREALISSYECQSKVDNAEVAPFTELSAVARLVVSSA